MAVLLVRSESVELLNRWNEWVIRAGHKPILVSSLAAAHQYLIRGQRLGKVPAVVITTMPPTEQSAAILHWRWLDSLRASAAPAPILLLASHPTLDNSPRPGSVVLAHPLISEASWNEHLRDLLDWPIQIARPY